MTGIINVHDGYFGIKNMTSKCSFHLIMGTFLDNGISLILAKQKSKIDDRSNECPCRGFAICSTKAPSASLNPITNMCIMCNELVKRSGD